MKLALFFFFNDTATTEIYTLSLHDALPICVGAHGHEGAGAQRDLAAVADQDVQDRKSTRLNSSHSQISYAVFCLKKKKREPPREKSLHSATPAQLQKHRRANLHGSTCTTVA